MPQYVVYCHTKPDHTFCEYSFSQISPENWLIGHSIIFPDAYTESLWFIPGTMTFEFAGLMS